MATDAHRTKQRLGKQARDAAVLHILDKYRDEFEAQVEKERLARGLTRTATSKTPEQLEEQLRKIKEQAAKVERELKASRRTNGN